MYVGAIAILFLFVIMLLHLKENPTTPAFATTGVAAVFAPAAVLVFVGLEGMVSSAISIFLTNSGGTVTAVNLTADAVN